MIRSIAVILALWLLCLGSPYPLEGAEAPKVSPTERWEKRLFSLLAQDDEKAYKQVLKDVHIVPVSMDTVGDAYDIVVRYNPRSYSNPRLISYPVVFDDQIVLWGLRMGEYTLRSGWKSHKYHLMDVSTGRRAWMYTRDCRMLYKMMVRARGQGRKGPKFERERAQILKLGYQLIHFESK